MDKHEAALKTYEILQARKKKKELQRQTDIACTGWNGYTKYMTKNQKRYYDKKHTLF